jgi:hypothetical protein
MPMDRLIQPRRVAALGAQPTVVALWVIWIAGCDTGKLPTYRVHGKVVFADGTPLTTGWVSFRALDAQGNVTARGPIQPDGTYELSTFSERDGAVKGRHQVLVTAPVYRNVREESTGAQPPLLDSRYSNFQTSGLEFIVTTVPEQNQFDVLVTSPKRR